MYNPAIGKFLSIDPLGRDYPFFTPYQFAGNSPISAIDLDGLEVLDYKIQQEKLFSGKAQIKVTYYRYVARDDDMPNKEANKIHAHLHVDGVWVADILINAGPTRGDNDGSPKKPKYGKKYAPGNNLEVNPLTTPISVMSKDDEDKGTRIGDIDILNIPRAEDVNASNPRYTTETDVSVGDKGWKYKKGTKVVESSHSSVEVGTILMDRNGYRTELLCDNTQGDCGGNNSDRNWAVSAKVMSGNISKAKNGNIPQKTEQARLFYAHSVNLVIKVINGDKLNNVTVENYNTTTKNKSDNKNKK